MYGWASTKRNNNRPVSINESSSGRGIPRSSSSSFPLAHYEKSPITLGRYGEYKVINKILKTLLYEYVVCRDFEDGWLKMIKDYSLEKMSDCVHYLMIETVGCPYM